MRVLWPHNFDTTERNAGIFMFTIAEYLRTLGADIQLEYLGKLRSPRNIIIARRHIRKISKEYDLVHSQYGSICGTVTSIVDSCPKVISLRGSDWNIYNDSIGFGYFHSRLSSALTHTAIKKYNCVLSVSNRMSLAIKNKHRNINVITFPSPIDLDLFAPLDKSKARRKLGYNNCDNEKWVLFTSIDRDNPIKRFSLAREAIKIANSEYGNIRLRIAENIPYHEMPLFVGSCDLILCTSEYEGWPNSIKEALACNIPFVSTDVSDLSKIADKETICKICPPDVKIIAQNICESLSGDNSNIDLRKYIKGMALEQSGEKLLKIYSSIL